MTRVSVIIPTYNRATHIANAIESILSQTFRDFDVIVVDDGSADDTRRVVQAYGAPVRYVYQANAGPGAARNHGIRLSTAPYVAFLDSDDRWMPEFLAKTVGALEAHPEVDVVTAGIYVGPADRKEEAMMEGVRTGVWRLPTRFTRRQIPVLLNGFWSGVVLARRAVLGRYGGYYEHGCTLGEDVYLWIQLVLNHKIYRIREPLAWYNTAASGLGFTSGRKHYPLEPVLVHPDPIWRHCPARHRPFLSWWLARHALEGIHLQLATGGYGKARWLLAHYPLVRQWKWEWWRIQFKLAFPGVTGLVRQAKHFLVRRPG